MKMNKEVVMVKLSDIIPNRFQPRLTFDEDALNELANSIKEHGIIQPLILRNLGTKYEIIAGERRYKASTIAGLTEVPAIVGAMDDQTSAELALIENIQRKDLSAIEEAKSYKKILEMGNFTQGELAKRMGKSQSTIANKMRLLTLTNEVQVALMNNLISERHARCLLQVKDSDMQKEVLNKIINERMNVRTTDDYIKNTLGIKKEDLTETRELNFDKEPEKINIELAKENNLESTSLNDIPDVSNKLDDEAKNPNVYSQTENLDFISLLNLKDKDLNIHNTNLETIDNLNKNIDSEKLNSKLSEEKNNEEVRKTEIRENKKEEIKESKKEMDNISKIKLATAIAIVKDSIKEMEKSGYKIKLEELEADNEYQIVIKIDK